MQCMISEWGILLSNESACGVTIASHFLARYTCIMGCICLFCRSLFGQRLAHEFLKEQCFFVLLFSLSSRSTNAKSLLARGKSCCRMDHPSYAKMKAQRNDQEGVLGTVLLVRMMENWTKW
jgi:hypothetical protein